MIKVHAQTPEKEAYFRGMVLQKANKYFPKLNEWCPPIYINITPPGGLLATHHHVPADKSYIYLAEVDIIPGWNDFKDQTEFVYHELAHIFEMKFMGRTAKTCDENFAQAVHDCVEKENKLLYALLAHMMG